MKQLDLERLSVVTLLGRGAKGVVFLVREEDQEGHKGELWALKVVLRDNNNNNNGKGGKEQKRIWFEEEVLRELNHPLLPRLKGVLSTDKVVGYAMDYCSGRDLNFLRSLQSENMFSIHFIRFYGTELVLALEHLHSQGIVYRDLKPENILTQENGHIMLVDFDLSKRLSPRSQKSYSIITSKPNLQTQPSIFNCFKGLGVSPYDRSSIDESSIRVSSNEFRHEPDLIEKSNSFVGTEEYVAPEIIKGQGHDFAVDWWSFGVVLYEMLYGVTPFKGVNRKDTFLNILTKSPELIGEATLLRDLIGKLLIKDPTVRIDLSGIKCHEFFSGVDWDLVLQVSRPPYIPPIWHFDETRKNSNRRIDVELFVQGIFGTKEEEKNNCDENQREDINRGGSKHNSLWVNGLNNQLQETENFLGF